MPNQNPKTNGTDLEGSKHILAGEGTSTVTVGRFSYLSQLSGSERVNWVSGFESTSVASVLWLCCDITIVTMVKAEDLWKYFRGKIRLVAE